MTAEAMALTTGWEPDLPVSDTMVRRYLFHNGELCAAFARAAGGHTLDTAAVAAADLRRPSGYWNAATLLEPPTDWDETLDVVEAFFAGGTGEAMLWSPWPTPDLRERGWRLSGHPPLLVRPPARDVPPPAIPVDDVRDVRTADDLNRWERVFVEGYPLPELAGSPPGTMAGPALLDDPRLRLFTAAIDGEPVSAAAMFVAHGIGSLAFGATLPAARRRGLWRQLAVTRLRAAPDVWMAGVFSDFSRPGAEALGFVPILRLTLWVRERPSQVD
jgi:ribosomal protein S18 acetylase RimI-like enzyme